MDEIARHTGFSSRSLRFAQKRSIIDDTEDGTPLIQFSFKMKKTEIDVEFQTALEYVGVKSDGSGQYYVERDINNLDFPMCAIDVSHPKHLLFVLWVFHWAYNLYENSGKGSASGLQDYAGVTRLWDMQYLYAEKGSLPDAYRWFNHREWSGDGVEAHGRIRSELPIDSFPKPYLQQMVRTVTSLLMSTLSACEIVGVNPIVRKMVYLAKYDPTLFDTATDKHIDQDALADCKGLCAVSTCLYQTENGGGGVHMYPECIKSDVETKCKDKICNHRGEDYVLTAGEGFVIPYPMYHKSINPTRGVMLNIVIFFQCDSDDNITRPRLEGYQKTMRAKFVEDSNLFKFSAQQFVDAWRGNGTATSCGVSN